MAPSQVDNIFNKVLEFIGATIQRFATSLYVLLACGALFGAVAVQIDPLLLFIPALLALSAYFSRTLSILLLIGLLGFFLL
ncbi:MAG: hypothetical protein Q7S21_00635 [archaeon]|nr:hypothetical protein [archaeon]